MPDEKYIFTQNQTEYFSYENTTCKQSILSNQIYSYIDTDRHPLNATGHESSISNYRALFRFFRSW